MAAAISDLAFSVFFKSPLALRNSASVSARLGVYHCASLSLRASARARSRIGSARLKTDEAVKLFKAGRSVTDIARALNIGRGSVYRALEAVGMKSASGWT